ncbi:MAG: glutamine amidotransferase-related protein, partial [Blastocatellia bacterium]
MKIGLLECDHVRAELNHIAGDYRDMFPALFNPHVPDIEFENFDVCNGKFPATVDDCDAYLATGSQSSAYDPDDWIQSLMGFVRQLSDANKRYVGICFGHQILAQALGGEVTPAPQGWGAGVHQLKVVNTESWMLPPQTTCNIQYTHGDQVRRLPEQSVVLG